MFFSIIIFEILLNRRVNAFVLVFVEKRVEINIFVARFCDDETSTNETKFFNIVLTICTKKRTSRRSRE